MTAMKGKRRVATMTKMMRTGVGWSKSLRRRKTNYTMMSRRRRRMPTGARRSVAPGLK